MLMKSISSAPGVAACKNERASEYIQDTDQVTYIEPSDWAVSVDRDTPLDCRHDVCLEKTMCDMCND